MPGMAYSLRLGSRGQPGVEADGGGCFFEVRLPIGRPSDDLLDDVLFTVPNRVGPMLLDSREHRPHGVADSRSSNCCLFDGGVDSRNSFSIS